MFKTLLNKQRKIKKRLSSFLSIRTLQRQKRICQVIFKMENLEKYKCLNQKCLSKSSHLSRVIWIDLRTRNTRPHFPKGQKLIWDIRRQFHMLILISVSRQILRPYLTEHRETKQIDFLLWRPEALHALKRWRTQSYIPAHSRFLNQTRLATGWEMRGNLSRWRRSPLHYWETQLSLIKWAPIDKMAQPKQGLKLMMWKYLGNLLTLMLNLVLVYIHQRCLLMVARK